MSLYSDRVLRDSPVIYLRLGEAPGDLVARDISGNGHDGVYTAGPVPGRPGMVPHDPATSVEFGAGTDYCIVTAHDDFDPVDAGDFTVEVVFRMNLASTAQAIVSNGPFSWGLYVTAANLLQLVRSPTTTMQAVTIEPGRVYHVIGVGSNTAGNVRLFVNGNLVSAAATGQSIDDVGAGDLYIGRQQAVAFQEFTGMIQELSFYPDVRLSDATCIEHYEAFLAAERAQTTFYIRDPVPPHAVLHQVAVADLGYAHVLMEPGEAAFRVSTNDPNLDDYAHAFQVGMACSVERDDGLFPFFGILTKARSVSGGGAVEFTAKDHVGALLNKAIAPLDAAPLSAFASGHIRRVFAEADARSHPPLLLDLDLDDGGPTVEYQGQGEYLDDFLRRMAEATGWEWGLRHELTRARAQTHLVWRAAQGADLSANALWEEGRQFTKATYTQLASAFISSAVAVGGRGAFNARPTGRADTGGHPLSPTRRLALGTGLQTERPTPGLLGTRIFTLPNVTNEASLLRSAERALDTPEHIREQLSFTLSEQAIDLSYPPAPGSLATVRFSDILSGASLTRVVRVLGLQLDPEAGTIDVEAKIEGMEEPGAIT